MSDQQQRKMTKRVKPNIEYTHEELDFSALLYEKFDSQQIKLLADHVEGLYEYQKILSLEIQHQERSIATLSKKMLERFPELQKRVSKLIEKGRFNMQFMDILLLPYKSLIQNKPIHQGPQQQQGQEHEHSHSHAHHNHSTVVNMFHQLASQWGQQEPLKYMKHICQYLLKFHVGFSKSQNIENSQLENRLLVVGCGMGRILLDLNSKFKDFNCFLQSHEESTEKYLCAEYFMNRCSTAQEIFPYIHNFNNYLKNQDPYRSVKVPFQLHNSTYFYPITLGKFTKLYRHHESQWSVIITAYQNYHIQDILVYIKLIYKMLRQGGIWIDVCTSNFDHNVIPFSYREYSNILDKSQFKLLEESDYKDYWFKDEACLMNEMRVSYFRVMQKC